MISNSSYVTITVQRFHALWEVIELPGIQPLYSSRVRAIEAACRLLKGRAGVIEIHDRDGMIDEIIDLRSQALAA